MTPVVEKALACFQAAPAEQQEDVAAKMLEALEFGHDPAYVAYLQEGLDAGEADIAAGRVTPLAEFTPAFRQEMRAKYRDV